ncbi:unnamed protein product [Sphenostylis stenocarpa]|uniref:Uncharacterized protein n=1 Tax=Sphenostylis stenocarpa TaxID=92480 RepID=A0AA86SWL8_9FABA|nr:unnamed protein product [Sphenostylis stenocarpa]
MMNGKMRMCKSESALKTLLPEKRVQRHASMLEHGLDKGKKGAIAPQPNHVDDKKAEKADKIMHLICWGPTLA